VAGGARLPDGISTLLAARDGTCWVGTTSGRLYFAPPGAAAWSTVDRAPLAGRRIRALAEDLRGRIWAGSESGLVAYGGASGPWTTWGPESGLKGPPVVAILADREGTLWFGFNGAGLQQWVGEAWTHRQVWDGPNPTHITVFGITGTADGFLAALFGRGLWRWDGRRMFEYGAREGLTEDVRYAVEPERGTIWAATRLGIFESRAAGRFRKVLDIPSGFATGLFRSPAGVWHATTTNHGIFRLGAEGWRAAAELNAPLPDLQARQLLWTATGELWIATMRGVVVFRDGEAWVLPPDRATGLPLASNCLLEPRPGEVWVGGYGGIAVHEGGKWRVMTAADGLPGNTIYSLARAADGSIWAGGSDGVGRFKGGRWTVYDSRTGLLEDECNLHGLWIAPDGSVLVGGMGSLARFDPPMASVPTAPLRVFWRDAPRPDADGVARLPSDRRALRVRWRGPWLSGQAVEYRTRVARLDADWSEPAKDTELRLENLSSGPWVFELAGRIEGTERWTEPLVLRVEIAPRAWETAWGRGVLALVAVLAVLALVRLRTRALAGRARELERVVEERTQELREEKERTEEQRAEAERHREAAERASRAKSMFLASMSHELRTPLDAILGFVRLLDRDRRLVEEQREQLGLIGRSGEHLLGLIDDVLSLSRIEAGQMTLDESPLDLSAMLRDVAEILRKRAQTQGLRLSLEISPSLPEIVMGDERKLRQILIKLVGNALSSTAKGGVTLRAGWSDGRGIFEVEDTGPGIADEELPSLFGAFAQVDAGRRSPEETGLGLLLSRAYARLMDGDVLVVSRVGVGTLFHVEVKLPEDRLQTALEPSAVPDSRASG
jgi:signal transduction histidine kinase